MGKTKKSFRNLEQIINTRENFRPLTQNNFNLSIKISCAKDFKIASFCPSEACVTNRNSRQTGEDAQHGIEGKV